MLYSDDLARIDFYIMINKISNYYLTCVCVLKTSNNYFICVCVEKIKHREIFSSPPRRDIIISILTWRFFVNSTSLACSPSDSRSVLFVCFSSFFFFCFSQFTLGLL